MNVENRDVIAKAYISALGGANNITDIEACITRIRTIVKDKGRVDEEELLKLGALKVLNRSEEELHIVLGMTSQILVEAIEKALNR
ncbi:MAG: PTS transporter subunit EIIB [Cellulosilyticaceae bacterium]